MKTASVYEIQKELSVLENKDLKELCLRLVKYKKENKELLSYLLFDAQDEKLFVKNIKADLDVLFSEMNTTNTYITKKGLRKILRIVNRYCKYSSLKQTDLELRIYFCAKVKLAAIPIDTNTVLANLYIREIKKIKTNYLKLHEDLQFDYKHEIDIL